MEAGTARAKGLTEDETREVSEAGKAKTGLLLLLLSTTAFSEAGKARRTGLMQGRRSFSTIGPSAGGELFLTSLTGRKRDKNVFDKKLAYLTQWHYSLMKL